MSRATFLQEQPVTEGEDALASVLLSLAPVLVPRIPAEGSGKARSPATMGSQVAFPP